MNFKQLFSFSGTMKLFYDANHVAAQYLAEKTKAQKKKLVISCSDSRIDAANIVPDALHSVFYMSAGQTLDAETLSRLQRQYPFHEIHIYGHQKCGACYAAHEYHEGKKMPTAQLLAVVKTAHPDEKQNVKNLAGFFKKTHSSIHHYHVRVVDGVVEYEGREICFPYNPVFLRDGKTYDMSHGQYPLAIVWRIGEQYAATEFVKGSVLDGKSQLFDVTSLEPLQKGHVPITPCEHGSIQYAMAHAFSKGSFECTNTFILLAPQQWEQEARKIFVEKLSIDSIVREYLNKGGQAYFCTHACGIIHSVYSVFF